MDADDKKMLQSILDEVTAIRRVAVAVGVHLGADKTQGKNRGRKTASGGVATDAELDSPRGDPEVFMDPRGWEGEPRKGFHYSACPAEYLDMLATMFDKFADSEQDEKKEGYKRKDAALARGWAARLRKQHTPPPADPPVEEFGG